MIKKILLAVLYPWSWSLAHQHTHARAKLPPKMGEVIVNRSHDIIISMRDSKGERGWLNMGGKVLCAWALGPLVIVGAVQVLRGALGRRGSDARRGRALLGGLEGATARHRADTVPTQHRHCQRIYSVLYTIPPLGDSKYNAIGSYYALTKVLLSVIKIWSKSRRQLADHSRCARAVPQLTGGMMLSPPHANSTVASVWTRAAARGELDERITMLLLWLPPGTATSTTLHQKLPTESR